jgi:Icc-related predicted phosphoesterase
MKIWAISDTHGNHEQLKIPEVDCLIYGGDSTNYKNLIDNQVEFYDFKNWLFGLPIKHKILIAGNHDAWATKKYNIDDLKHNNVIYLDHAYINIEGLNVFGSPYTPVFGDWYFMVNTNKIGRYWEALEPDIDILVTHGPPKGILDLSHNKKHILEYCGDSALRKAVFKVKPKYHIFGHIHDSEDCYNQGVRIINDTEFMNVSCVTDGKLDRISSNGIIFDINV